MKLLYKREFMGHCDGEMVVDGGVEDEARGTVEMAGAGGGC